MLFTSPLISPYKQFCISQPLQPFQRSQIKISITLWILGFSFKILSQCFLWYHCFCIIPYYQWIKSSSEKYPMVMQIAARCKQLTSLVPVKAWCRTETWGCPRHCSWSLIQNSEFTLSEGTPSLSLLTVPFIFSNWQSERMI